ncbi:MAG TPA: alpha/beta fold hydrolase [Pirellulales bacterium]|jgi:pimeloyl-ACP methyl ester carboxylesterase|nr:alpha/beta fold hydrolase [Pirellulales bacterium]
MNTSNDGGGANLAAKLGQCQASQADALRPNWRLPTLGGRHLWADELFFHGWHIQRNVVSGHCRLLDADNWRHAWGTFEHCQVRLAEIRAARRLPSMQGSGLILMHGLVRSAAHMAPLARHLRAHTQHNIFNVTYPTTRGSIDEHAEQLARIIERLEGIDDLWFVGHSLGSLVVRRYLASASEKERSRVRRIVMLGPPNQAARMAEVFGRQPWFGLLLGKAASQLRDLSQQKTWLAVPTCPFGIIAGGRSGPRGYNPWLSGDNDLLVDVASTRLPGAADFAVVPVIHAAMMSNPVVQQYTLRFLETGAFISPERRQPIPLAG